MIVAGEQARLAEAFREHPAFWLNRQPPANLGVYGFTFAREELTESERENWDKIAPAKVASEAGETHLATDDWPFLYLRKPTVPWLLIRAMVLIGGLGLAMVFLFSPGRRVELGGRMFFLGAAFMLLETKAVVHLALLFGSTWMVNSAVFFTILLMILAANVYVLKMKPTSLTWHYAALLLSLTANAVIPLDLFLTGSWAWRYLVPCALVLLPIFFAGVIFATSFRDSQQPDRDFGANIAGSVVGGLTEYFSMLLGFRYLLFVAMAFYAVSALVGNRRNGDAS